MGVRGSGPNQNRVLLNTPSQTGFPDPISPIIAPYFPFDLLRLRQPHDREQVYATTGARQVPPLAISAQMTRAILFANATLTSIAGLRAIMLASHEPAGAPFRAAQRTTELAPMMSRRRSVCSPIFDVAPSLCFPPVECCNGVSPSQAAKSRPRLNVSAGGASAAMAPPDV